MKHSPRFVGILQALGIALYVSLFASVITLSESSTWLQGFEPPMPFGPILFLLAFIISATVYSLLMFGYPFYLFMHEKKREAICTVLWTVCFLTLILALISAYVFLYIRPL